MRTFLDGTGVRWDVVAGRESWGATFAIFVRRGGEGEVRQTLLEATSPEEAARELSDLNDDGLRALLKRSEPKDI